MTQGETEDSASGIFDARGDSGLVEAITVPPSMRTSGGPDLVPGRSFMTCGLDRGMITARAIITVWNAGTVNAKPSTTRVEITGPYAQPIVSKPTPGI